MTQQTLDFIHKSYQEALANSEPDNTVQIVNWLYSHLSSAEVPDEDSQEFDLFLDGLRSCLHFRKLTADITDISTYLSVTIMHIMKWLNVTKGLSIAAYMNGRRKSLESDLTKLLRKSTQTLSARIRDRFGLRGTIINKPEELAIEYIYLIRDSIVGILAAKNRKLRSEFSEWVETSALVNSVNRAVIKEILLIPFDVDADSYKDYIENEKPNGYRSLHFTLNVQPYSKVVNIRGAQLEVQLRSKEMDVQARSGSASHAEYKRYQKDEDDDNPLLKVFVDDNFDYDKPTNDGVHGHKLFVDRQFSRILVPHSTEDL